jgi:hypothetical protein
MLKGEASNSAIKQISNTIKPIGCSSISQIPPLCHWDIVLIERLLAAIAGPLNAKAIGSSKLIICNIAREPPIIP